MLYIIQLTMALTRLEEQLKVHNCGQTFPRIRLFKDMSGHIQVDYLGETLNLCSFSKETLSIWLSDEGIDKMVALPQFVAIRKKREAKFEAMSLETETES